MTDRAQETMAPGQHHAITLPDGRALAYATWGDPAGAPVFSFHGGGNSRLDRPHDASVLRSVRLVTMDRPGHGLSDFQPGRSLLDWPADVRALADALGIERFAVYGVSGGGPYVVACAFALPDRITRAAIVSSSLQPPQLPQVTFQQVEAAFTSLWPGVVEAMRAGPERGVEAWISAVGGVDECDRAVLSRPDVFAMGAEAIIEGARQGVEGVAYDLGLILTKPWGFDAADIEIDVDIWHGALDRIVPLQEAERMAATIPRSHLTVVANAGHLLAVDRLPDILERLTS